MARKKRIAILSALIALTVLIIIGILIVLYLKTDAFKTKETLFAKYMQFPHPKQAQLFEGYQNPEPQTISPEGGEYSFVFPVIEYPITYHLNDDAESPATNPNTKTKCTIEDDEYVLQSPTRTGYTFKRWNTYEEDYESGAISKIPAHSMESYVLYAIWTRNE